MARLRAEQNRSNTEDVSNGLPLDIQESGRMEEVASSGEGWAPKRLQKHSPNGMNPNRPPEPTLLARVRPDPIASASHRRRQSSLRDQGPLQVSNPLHVSPSKRLANNSGFDDYTANSTRSLTPNTIQGHRIPQDSINGSSRFSFASKITNSKTEDSHYSNSFDFLPSVNFDDFHASIAVDGTDINLFPIPGTDLAHHPSATDGVFARSYRSGIKPSKTLDASELNFGAGLNESLPRRQNSINQREGRASDRTETTTTLNGIDSTKARRKSYFPTTSNAASGVRAPRKSVGPGILTSETDLQKNRYRRPSLAQGGLREGHTTSDLSLGNGTILSRTESANFNSGRYQEAKLSQQTPRKFHEHNSIQTGIASERQFTMGNTARSPGKSSLQRTITPSSSQRLSVMPNSAHATGLAARTISPTDARRIKRMSMMPNPRPVPNTPPTPQPETPTSAGVPSASFPSTMTRKSVTPTSSRTTPDPNRKSYSSGFSTSSNTSYNSCVASTGPTRMSQSTSVSRLPTPKTRPDNAKNDDDEVVPPVPAIPKAYESPKAELDTPFFPLRKPSLPYDVNLNSTSAAPVQQEFQPLITTKDINPNTSVNHGVEPATERKPSGGSTKRRTLQPLRLPPLNLLPLSTPTTAKIAALYDGSSVKQTGTTTPPSKKGTKATPTTPMTASKATFSRAQYEVTDATMPQQVRSSSSHHTTRPKALSYRASSGSSRAETNPADQYVPNAGRTAMSPFISSSLPKSSGEFGHLKREVSNPLDVPHDSKPVRPTGPRLQKPRKSSKNHTFSLGTASPSETSTPSLGTSIRRKLSVTRKRSVSKAQTAAERNAEIAPKPPKHDDMPPPKLPASATWNGPLLSSPSPSQKLRASRKVSNADSVMQQQPNRSNTLETIEKPQKETKLSQIPNVAGLKRNARSVLDCAPNEHSLSMEDFLREAKTMEPELDRDDLVAEEEMKRLASKRRETETAAKEIDALRRRATAKERVSPNLALRTASLNIFERGEIADFEFEEKGIYFCGTRDAKKHVGDLNGEVTNFGYDDERGDYNIVNGDHLAYRYEIVDILGKGSFGQVVRCIDHMTGGLVAIKIIRNKKRFHQQALVEVDILKKLREWDPQNKHSMVNFTQSFYFRCHLCISTELLGINLYEFIKCHDFRGFSLKLIRRFAKQLLSSLILLKRHKVIHCDLKPENVLLAHPARSEIKVIDFGSSCLENEKVYTYIQSRFYRSPEVILGMTYGMPIDMWSLGCILSEILTGYPIFPGENEQEQLACIMEVFGPPEKHLIEKSTRKKLFFDSLGKPRITVSSKGKRRRPSSKSLQQALKCEDEAFLDFITRCLRWDPDRRLKPDEAIHHEFIAGKAAKRAPRPRTAPTNSTNSPIKRYNSVTQTPSSTRPLPETPATNFKTAIAPRNRDTSASSNFVGSSPSKQAAQMVGQKRHSTASGLHSTSSGTGFKRNFNGATVQGSALPRVASTQRSGSGVVFGGLGKGTSAIDLAAAAAAASLATRTK